MERVKKKRLLYKLIIAKSDIGYARNASRHIIENRIESQNELFYPLYCATVICYGRPFSQNRPYGPLPKTWGEYKTKEEHDIHELLIRTRNEFIAHSDYSARRAGIVPPLKLEGRIRTKDFGYVVHDHMFALDRFTSIYTLCEDLHNRIHQAVKSLIVELYEDKDLPNCDFDLVPDEEP